MEQYPYDKLRSLLKDMGIDCTTVQNAVLPTSGTPHIAVISNGNTLSISSSSKESVIGFRDDLKRVGIDVDVITLKPKFWHFEHE